MENVPAYDRPNTVIGLVAKRKELSDLRERHHAEIKKLTVDIDHLDAAIRLFDPTEEGYRVKRYAARHRARKGSLRRFMLNMFREAKGPLTSRQITEAWIKEQGLSADNDTYTMLRGRTGASISACRAQGLIEEVANTSGGEAKGQYKFWQLKKGGP